MLKGKLPQMNHLLVHFECYLQRFCPKKVIFFGAKHNLKTPIRCLAERVPGAERMVSFFPARRPGTRAGKNDDVRMLKGKLPQMNHLLVHFECYLQRFCEKSVFFGAKHNL